MCGIAGIYNYAEPGREADRDLVVKMTRSIAHRGPDGEGIYADGPVALGHRRLAIVDLSPAGAQPMASASGESCLVYNGEIYNHAEFRSDLLSRGVRFRGTSDTETLVNLFEREGVDCLRGLAGIFAFALWDRRQRVLTLARDPLGVKQVYYHDDGRRILFASEIKALLLCPGVPREPDPEAINQYLHFHTPLFERTFFKHIRQIRPGEYARVSTAAMHFGTYWSAGRFGSRANEPAAAVEELRERLSHIVGEQLMSDVPVGAFFSGGIDSSAVAAFAARNGKPPECFGVHFTGQGVIDERPFQEAAAESLGVRLNLITSDGSGFPDEMARLMYYQDQPVIGPAMFPMHYVSRLAASKVKVCLGGQAADEIFGGYARYALTRPGRVLRTWLTGRKTPGPGAAEKAAVGGNLGRQLHDRRNLGRLLQAAHNMTDWQARYFLHFAKVPADRWRRLIPDAAYFDRRRCWDTFRETLRKSPAADPADQAMHWDMQTYLPGLFHQDDRMSMSVSLESRVPLADPRLVELAFQMGFDLKFRAGATKWLLRQAVSDVLPALVLNRRKVGFDTPIESWIKRQHLGFVRDMLESSRCRERGLFDPKAIGELLGQPEEPFWIDLVWKALSIEVWGRTMLDEAPQSRSLAAGAAAGGNGNGRILAPEPQPVSVTRGAADPRAATCAGEAGEFSPRYLVREVREMGARTAVKRAAWELMQRSGLSAALGAARRNGHPDSGPALRPVPLLFADPCQVANEIAPRLHAGDLDRLRALARQATQGRILSFGRWITDYGMPVDWHRNPHNGRLWPSEVHCSKAPAAAATVGDIKLTWEAARFPHAYLMARAAAFIPDSAPELCAALTGQVRAFIAANPGGRGIHWNSGQEIAIRLMAWIFALNCFSRLDCDTAELNRIVKAFAADAGEHIAANIAYARDLIPNNHLISEALGLYAAGAVAVRRETEAWTELGRRLLADCARTQFYADGAYLQQSHNYHRNVLQLYACAAAIARASSRPPDPAWLDVMDRSLDFLLAHQNPSDGRLPNYGANDGSLPCVLTSCDFTDYRPILQTLSIICRSSRLYESGPWDEEAAWLFGAGSLAAPLQKRVRTSMSFSKTGHHVLRGRDESTFAAFRCGALRDRYSQMDMLHVDVWWRGENVLVDGGSYLYNGPEKWHRHFVGTASHNTVVVDGRDQMVHFRRFKNLYWTEATLLEFRDHPDRVLASGEHYGFRRYPGRCVHRRSVLLIKDDLWIVADRIAGSGRHTIRNHWLGGPFPYSLDASMGRLTLETPAGAFHLSVLSGEGVPLAADVAAGSEDPPRGWLSRYYGEKIPVPSMAVEHTAELPVQTIAVMAGGSRPKICFAGGIWTVRTASAECRFRIEDGLIRPVATVATAGGTGSSTGLLVS